MLQDNNAIPPNPCRGRYCNTPRSATEGIETNMEAIAQGPHTVKAGCSTLCERSFACRVTTIGSHSKSFTKGFMGQLLPLKAQLCLSFNIKSRLPSNNRTDFLFMRWTTQGRRATHTSISCRLVMTIGQVCLELDHLEDPVDASLPGGAQTDSPVHAIEYGRVPFLRPPC